MKLKNKWQARLLAVALTGVALSLPGAWAWADELADGIVVAELDGCNEQSVGEDGLTIRWTSAFEDGHYGFEPVKGMRSR
jgi:hypothetical protein